MAALAGKDIIIYINTTGSTYVSLGGLRAKSAKLNSQSIDVTNSDSTGLWRELLATAGVKSLDITGSGVFLDGADVNKIVSNMMTTTQIYNAKLGLVGFGEFAGSFAFENFSIDGNHDGEVTFSVDIKSSGQPTFTAS